MHGSAEDGAYINQAFDRKAMRRSDALLRLAERALCRVSFRETKRSSQGQLCGKLEVHSFRRLWADFGGHLYAGGGQLCWQRWSVSLANVVNYAAVCMSEKA